MKTYTPTPWQQSVFVPQPGKRYTDEFIRSAKNREETLVRGPGVVGGSACNVVCEVYHPDDRHMVIRAVNNHDQLVKAINDILTEIKRPEYAELIICGHLVGVSASGFLSVLQRAEEALKKAEQ